MRIDVRKIARRARNRLSWYKPKYIFKRAVKQNSGVTLGYLLSVATFVAVVVLGFTTWYGLQDPSPKLLPINDFLATAQWTGSDFGVLMLVVVATVLVTFQPGRRLREFCRDNPSEGGPWVVRSTGLMNLRAAARNAQPKADPWVHLRPGFERLLKAAHEEIERELGIFDNELIKVNLLVFDKDSPGELVVVARSRPGSPVGVQYQHNPEKFTASEAIKKNEVVIHSHVKEIRGDGDPPYDPHCQTKPYNCVAAVPITVRAQAFGAVSVDSKKHTTFKGKQAVINAILRPCAAEIVLGLPHDTPHRSCPPTFLDT